MRLRRFSPVAAFGVGWLLFGGLLLVARGAASTVSGDGAAVFTAHQLVLKGGLLALSFGLLWVARRPLRELGLCRPVGPPGWGAVAVGALLGATATVLILVTPARGIEPLGELGLLRLILLIWLLSSLSEEVFLRGLMHRLVRVPRGAEAGADSAEAVSWRSPVVVTVALLFSTMHLSLLLIGTDPWTVAIILVATFCLGLVAGVVRERTGSLVGAVGAHIAFNIAGFAAGVVWIVARGLPPGP